MILGGHNWLAELAGWYSNLLPLEFKSTAELDHEFELALTGFDPAEIEALLNGLDSEPPSQPAIDMALEARHFGSSRGHLRFAIARLEREDNPGFRNSFAEG